MCFSYTSTELKCFSKNHFSFFIFQHLHLRLTSLQVTNHIQQWLLFQQTCYLVVWRFFFFLFLSCVAQEQRLSLLMYTQPRISSRPVTFILMLGKPRIFFVSFEICWFFLFDKQTKESTNRENNLFITTFP